MAKSSAVREVVGGGGGEQRRLIKCSEESTHVWSPVALVVEM